MATPDSSLVPTPTGKNRNLVMGLVKNTVNPSKSLNISNRKRTPSLGFIFNYVLSINTVI